MKPSVSVSTEPAAGPAWRWAGIGLLLLYVLAGWIYSYVLPPAVHYWDEDEYLDLARNLVHGPGFSIDGHTLMAGRAPAYAFFLAAIQVLGGGFVAMRMAQFVLIAGTILLVCRMCAGQQRFAMLALVTALVFLYPVLFYTGGTLFPQTLAGFLFVASLALMLSPGPHGLLPDLAAGLIYGVLILTVPTFGLTLLVLLAAAWLLKLLSWRGAVAVFFGASLIIGMWTIRNFIEFHRFVPVATNSGANLLLGNNENAVPSGAAGVVDVGRYQAEAYAKGMDEFQSDRYYREQALTWIKTHPGRAAILYLEKTANYFNFRNDYAKVTQADVSPWKQNIMAMSYLLLLALLAWRLIELGRFPLSAPEKLFLILYVASAFTMAIFVTRIRLRLPYDYLIITVVALHLSRRLELWLGRKGA